MGLNRKHLEHLLSWLVALKSGRGSITSWIFRIRDFLVFILMLPFSKYFAFVFFMLITDNIFLFTAPLMRAPFYVNSRPNVDTVCFQKNQRVFMALKKSFSKNLTDFLSFAFNCYSFGSLIFKFNHSKI